MVGNFRQNCRQHSGMSRTMGRVMIELIASHLVGTIARVRQMIPSICQPPFETFIFPEPIEQHLEHIHAYGGNNRYMPIHISTYFVRSPSGHAYQGLHLTGPLDPVARLL